MKSVLEVTSSSTVIVSCAGAVLLLQPTKKMARMVANSEKYFKMKGENSALLRECLALVVR